jgi:Spy/CpxP family protein refolding chaperone
MKTLNLLRIAIAAFGLVSLATVAQTTDAQKCEHNEHHQHHNDMNGDDEMGPMGHRHFDKNHLPEAAGLNLTDAQKKTFADARTAQEPAMHELHEKMRAAHEALDEAGGANADDATLTRLSSDLAALVAQQEVARIKIRRQWLSVLTPEQTQKLEAFKAEYRDAPHWKDQRKEVQ